MDEATNARIDALEKTVDKHDQHCTVRWEGMYSRMRRVEIILYALLAVAAADHAPGLLAALS